MIQYRLLLLSAALLVSRAHVERRRQNHPGCCFVDRSVPTSHRCNWHTSRSPSVSHYLASKARSLVTTRRPTIVRHRDASLPSVASPASSSIISPSDAWGNIAVLSFAASLAQLLGRTTMIGRLLGAPVTAMALSFALSSVDWIPRRPSLAETTSTSTSTSSWALTTLLPPGGSPASAFLQSTSLTLATPLLLLGTSLRGGAIRRCGSLLASFVIASSGTLAGAIAAFSIPSVRHDLGSSLPYHRDGAIIASALLAKNIGGGINYVAVCSCLGASPESVAAGLCVDNVMALLYFPLISLIASKYGDCDDDDHNSNPGGGDGVDRDDGVGIGGDDTLSPMEALSHAMTLAAVLTALGQFLNSQLRHLPSLIGRAVTGTVDSESSRLNLSLPITTLLAVLFSTYFLSPTKTRSRNENIDDHRKGGGGGNDSNGNIARAGQTLGTSLLYLFFATAGAPGWKLKDSIQTSFPSIASFLVILYGVHGCVLLGTRTLITRAIAASSMGGKDPNNDDNHNDGETSFWEKMAAPQRLLVASSAAIGGPATAAALAKSFRWESLLTPSLIVGNVGYAVATFIGLLFYSVYR